MIADFVVGIFTVANSFIAMFILIYAFLFLKKTKSHKDRRPWDYLLLASAIYLIYTILVILLQIYRVTLVGEINLYHVSLFFQFMYTGMILLSFISQTDLIFKNDVIIIMRKLAPEEKDKIMSSEAHIGTGEAQNLKSSRSAQKAAEPEGNSSDPKAEFAKPAQLEMKAEKAPEKTLAKGIPNPDDAKARKKKAR